MEGSFFKLEWLEVLIFWRNAHEKSFSLREMINLGIPYVF